jgi:uncharacterized protein YndB with AHSA1/START domain
VGEYSLLTTWCLDATRERVWDAIWDSERWPEWWRGVVSSERLVEGDESGLGQVGRYTWRLKRPYALDFQITTTRIEKPHLLEGQARGELAGVGRWRLFEEDADGDPVTAVVYEWNVHTTRRWMNLLSPIAHRVFEWNHDWVMRNGGEGIARLLGCRLLAAG